MKGVGKWINRRSKEKERKLGGQKPDVCEEPLRNSYYSLGGWTVKKPKGSSMTSSLKDGILYEWFCKQVRERES